MSVPEYLLVREEHQIHLHFLRILKSANLGKSGMASARVEITLGHIINIVLNARIHLASTHAVVFDSMPNEFRFESGISQIYYSKAMGLMRGPAVQVHEDSISFNGTIRKVASRGTSPTYQKKTRRIIGYVHFPLYSYDAQVSVVAIEEIENPDRTVKNYIFRKGRKIHSLASGGSMLKLVQISSGGEVTDKGSLAGRVDVGFRNYTYQALVEVSGDTDHLENVPQKLAEFISRGFQFEKKVEWARRL